MWYFQQLNQFRAQVFGAKCRLYFKFLAAIFLVHTFLLLALFIGYRGNCQHLVVTLNSQLLNNNLEILFIPTLQSSASQFKTIAHAKQQSSSAQKKGPAVIKKAPVQKTVAAVQTTKKIETPKPSTKNKPTIKKIEPKKPDVKKSDAPKKVDTPKKTVEKTVPVEKKKIEEKKTAPKKTEPKKVEEKKQDNLPEKMVKEELKPAAVPILAAVAQPVASASAADIGADEPLVIHATAQEIEAYRRANLLQQELVRVWHPPVGIAKDTNCTINCQVNWQGGVHDVTIQKTSGILMYDVAARSALYAMQLPEWARGKSLTIIFKV